MSKHIHDAYYCQFLEIFSGECSEDLWEAINGAKSKKQLRKALYLVCCRIQELESRLDNARSRLAVLETTRLDEVKERKGGRRRKETA